MSRIIVALSGLATVCLLACNQQNTPNVKGPEYGAKPAVEHTVTPKSAVFTPPDTNSIPHDKTGEMIRYGRELIRNFPKYLGPNGSVGKFAGNNMSCQNCHLDAGTRPFGLSYMSAHARYPQYRSREGKILTLGDRVNNCIERPLNGKAMPLDSKEMVAILSYMQWLSKGVPVDGRVEGDDLKPITLLDRAADPNKGKVIFNIQCARCHGVDGEGKMLSTGNGYEYPPLWGRNSYQPGSSMHRLIKAAQFIKYNMPFDLARWDKPVLTDEEALDVAAYVNDDIMHVRPKNSGAYDYPNDLEKPVDLYKAPYADPFPQSQHKYGPFKPIISWRKEHKQKTGY